MKQHVQTDDSVKNFYCPVRSCMAHTNPLKTFKIWGSCSDDEDKLFCDVTMCHRVSSSDVLEDLSWEACPWRSWHHKRQKYQDPVAQWHTATSHLLNIYTCAHNKRIISSYYELSTWSEIVTLRSEPHIQQYGSVWRFVCTFIAELTPWRKLQDLALATYSNTHRQAVRTLVSS